LRLQQQGDKVQGDYIGARGKELPVQDLKFKEGELSFRVPDEIDEDKVTLNYLGKVTGDRIQGTAKLGTGNQVASVKFQAHKIKPPTATVGGAWKLKVPFKEGVVFEPTLKLVQEGSGLNGFYLGDQGETAIADALILGDEFTFEVNRTRDGKRFKLRYQGRIKDDALKGSVDYDFDGMTGSLDFEGKRLAAPNPNSEKKP